jgi:UDP-N-acetylglucosamine 2-epimerase (non-hydrolysing)
MKVVHVIGARPNFMKTAPIMREMAKYPQEFEQILVHTGQHYDDEMSQVFFDDLDLPRPDVYLGVGSASHAQQTARIMLAFEPVPEERRIVPSQAQVN